MNNSKFFENRIIFSNQEKFLVSKQICLMKIEFYANFVCVRLVEIHK